MHDGLLRSRRLAKAVVARTLGPFLPANRFLVVGYHRVVERFDWAASLTMPASLVSCAMFERHLDCIGRDHEFVSLDEVGERLSSGARIARPLAAVTFDDGYRDVYENALPLLKRKGIPAAVFLVTNLVGTSQLHAHDKLHSLMVGALRAWTRPNETLRLHVASAEIPEGRGIRIPDTTDPFVLTRALLVSLSSRSLDRLIEVLGRELATEDLVPAGFLPLSWEMVDEMHRAGITIGSHTASHARLTNETPADVVREVVDSRQQLERKLGQPIVHFAYPDGQFNRTAVNAVREAGYRFGYTTCEHRDRREPLLTIPRRMLWEHSTVDSRGRFFPSLLRCQERGFLLGARTCSWQSHA